MKSLLLSAAFVLAASSVAAIVAAEESCWERRSLAETPQSMPNVDMNKQFALNVKSEGKRFCGSKGYKVDVYTSSSNSKNPMICWTETEAQKRFCSGKEGRCCTHGKRVTVEKVKEDPLTVDEILGALNSVQSSPSMVENGNQFDFAASAPAPTDNSQVTSNGFTPRNQFGFVVPAVLGMGSCGVPVDFNSMEPFVALDASDFGGTWMTDACQKCVVITTQYGLQVKAKVRSMCAYPCVPGTMQLSAGAAAPLGFNQIGVTASLNWDFVAC